MAKPAVGGVSPLRVPQPDGLYEPALTNDTQAGCGPPPGRRWWHGYMRPRRGTARHGLTDPHSARSGGGPSTSTHHRPFPRQDQAIKTNRILSGALTARAAHHRVGHPGSARPGRDPLSDVAPGRSWVRLAQNRFWLLVPILVLNLALVGRLPPPLAPGSPGPDISGWVSVSETVLRVVVFGAPLLMPLSLRTPRTRPALAGYSVASWRSRPISRPGWPSSGHPPVHGAPGPSGSPHSPGPRFCCSRESVCNPSFDSSPDTSRGCTSALQPSSLLSTHPTWPSSGTGTTDLGS